MISCLYQKWLSNAQFIPEYLKDRWNEIMIFDSDFLEIDYDQDYSIKGIDYDDNQKDCTVLLLTPWAFISF